MPHGVGDPLSSGECACRACPAVPPVGQVDVSATQPPNHQLEGTRAACRSLTDQQAHVLLQLQAAQLGEALLAQHRLQARHHLGGQGHR